MTELLFGVTLAFVGYVLYEVFKTVWEDKTEQPASPQTALAADPVAADSVKPTPAPETVAAKPAPLPAKTEPKPASVQAAKPKPAPAAPKPAAPAVSGTDRGAVLRNPATGETSPTPTNYRFAKKWIKEALVAEGLLDHIYKPNELDEAVSEKVREAIEKFRLLDKYQD